MKKILAAEVETQTDRYLRVCAAQMEISKSELVRKILADWIHQHVKATQNKTKDAISILKSS